MANLNVYGRPVDDLVRKMTLEKVHQMKRWLTRRNECKAAVTSRRGSLERNRQQLREEQERSKEDPQIKEKAEAAAVEAVRTLRQESRRKKALALAVPYHIVFLASVILPITVSFPQLLEVTGSTNGCVWLGFAIAAAYMTGLKPDWLLGMLALIGIYVLTILPDGGMVCFPLSAIPFAAVIPFNLIQRKMEKTAASEVVFHELKKKELKGYSEAYHREEKMLQEQHTKAQNETAGKIKALQQTAATLRRELADNEQEAAALENQINDDTNIPDFYKDPEILKKVEDILNSSQADTMSSALILYELQRRNELIMIYNQTKAAADQAREHQQGMHRARMRADYEASKQDEWTRDMNRAAWDNTRNAIDLEEDAQRMRRSQ